MSKKTINYLGIDAQSSEDDQEYTLRLTSRRSLAFGPGTVTRILLPEEDEESELSRHRKDVRGAMLLKHTKDSFLTCGADHGMIVWRTFGREMAELSGHTDKITGIWELEDKRIVSLGLDKTVRVWNTRSGEELCSVETTVEGPGAVQFSDSEDFFCLIEKSGARIVTLDGETITVLKNQNTTLDVFFALNDEQWLTVSNKTPRLWSRKGKMLHEFRTGFSLQDGFLALQNGGLLVADTTDQLLLFDSAGKRSAVRQPDKDVATSARKFFRAWGTAHDSMHERSTVDHFMHRNSHRSQKFVGIEALEEQEIPDDVLKKNRPIWDFFNRPDIRLIKTFLKNEIATARSCETEIGDALDGHTKAQKSASRNRAIFLVLTLISATAAVVAGGNDTGVFAIATVIGLLSLYGAFRAQRKLSASRRGAKVLEALVPQFEILIQAIKKFRRGILSEVPIFKSHDAYSGRSLDDRIQQTIENTIKPVARRECGIMQDEQIISEDREPRLLRDWAFIQDKSDPVSGNRDPATLKIDPHNELSFWWSNDLGRFVFAVQFLQFIFLGKEKIDVFTTFYDFVKDEFIAKKSHTFYYKDVTNISKLELTRQWSSVGHDGETLEATQILMAVSSGQQIPLTVLNEQSMKTLRTQSTDSEGLTTEERIAQIQREIEKLRSDDSLDEEERNDEISERESSIAILEAERVPDDKDLDSTSTQETHADKVIAIIRKQISEHKMGRVQDPGENG